MVDRNHSRRAVLSGITAAGVVAATAAAAMPAKAAPADEADRLYRELVALLPEREALSKAWKEAFTRVPEWAKSGPKYILRSAEDEPHYFGKRVHWPLDTTITNVEIFGPHAICRPGPDDLKLAFKNEMREVARALSGRSEADVRARHRKRLRAFIERTRAAEAEYGRECGPIDDAVDKNLGKRCDIEAAIYNLPPTPNSVAALVLLSADEQNVDAYADVLDLQALRHIGPHTSGLIRDHLDHWFKVLEDEPYTKLIALPPFYDVGLA
ncbi:MAG: hypothetical protein JWL86_4493 [Rhizobium sp.]|nr:hypothetical protein [Rhizobium sp.]